MFYIGSCKLNAAQAPACKKEQKYFARISVGEDDKETKEAVGPNPVFQQGFTFFLRKVEGEVSTEVVC